MLINKIIYKNSSNKSSLFLLKSLFLIFINIQWVMKLNCIIYTIPVMVKSKGMNINIANVNSPFKLSLNVYLSLLILNPPILTILIFN